ERGGDGLIVLLDRIRDTAQQGRHECDDESPRIVATLARFRQEVREWRLGEVPVVIDDLQLVDDDAAYSLLAEADRGRPIRLAAAGDVELGLRRHDEWRAGSRDAGR